jgi:hypothetical protein
MTEPIVVTPIGVVRGGRSQIYEDHWSASKPNLSKRKAEMSASSDTR